MEPTTILIVAAVAAVLLAIILWVTGGSKKRAEEKPLVGVKPIEPIPAPPPMKTTAASPSVTKRMKNKRGWKAPAGHYFNEMDQLVNDIGDVIIDMMIIAELCGEEYTVIDDLTHESADSAEIADDSGVELTEEPAPPIDESATTEPAPAVEPVGTENISSPPQPAPVAPAPLPDPAPSPPEPASMPEVKSDFGSGFADNSSFGDSFGGGGDSSSSFD